MASLAPVSPVSPTVYLFSFAPTHTLCEFTCVRGPHFSVCCTCVCVCVCVCPPWRACVPGAAGFIKVAVTSEAASAAREVSASDQSSLRFSRALSHSPPRSASSDADLLISSTARSRRHREGPSRCTMLPHPCICKNKGSSRSATGRTTTLSRNATSWARKSG